MPDYACILQAGQRPDRSRAELTVGLQQIAAEMFGSAPEKLEIQWITVAEGFGFTAGKPSSSSIVVGSMPEGCPDEERTRFMTRVTELWQRVTDCTPNEIVVTALDGPIPL